jgi:outer membrane protein assembly factor BamB
MKPTSFVPCKPAVFLSVVLCLSSALLGQTVSVLPTNGPPTTKTYVSGSGFAPNAEIYLYFDSTYESVTFANSSGSFSVFAIQVPASAVPGEHWVSAVQVSTDTGAQASFRVHTNWSTFGFTASGGRSNPYENVLNPENVGNLQLKWSYFTGNTGIGHYGSVYPSGGAGVGITPESSAAVVDGVVYIGWGATNGPGDTNTGGVYALNATTGKSLWQTNLGEPILSTAAVAPCAACGLNASEVLYFGGYYYAYALNAANGELLAGGSGGGELNSTPVIVDGAVYMGNNSGNFSALNGYSLNLPAEWQYDTGAAVDSPAAVYNGALYVGNEAGSGDVYAFPENYQGSPLFETNGCGPVETSTAVVNGILYFGDDGGCVTAYGTDTYGGISGIIWSAAMKPTPIQSLAVSGGAVYAANNKGELFAFDALNGDQLWGVFPCQMSCLYSNVFYSSPAVANGVVYVGGMNFAVGDPLGFIAAVDAATGAVLWNYSLGGVVEASPTVVNGMLYVQADDGYMYAFGLPNPQQPQARPEFGALHR